MAQACREALLQLCKIFKALYELDIINILLQHQKAVINSLKTHPKHCFITFSPQRQLYNLFVILKNIFPDQLFFPVWKKSSKPWFCLGVCVSDIRCATKTSEHETWYAAILCNYQLKVTSPPRAGEMTAGWKASRHAHFLGS